MLMLYIEQHTMDLVSFTGHETPATVFYRSSTFPSIPYLPLILSSIYSYIKHIVRDWWLQCYIFVLFFYVWMCNFLYPKWRSITPRRQNTFIDITIYKINFMGNFVYLCSYVCNINTFFKKSSAIISHSIVALKER